MLKPLPSALQPPSTCVLGNGNFHKEVKNCPFVPSSSFNRLRILGITQKRLFLLPLQIVWFDYPKGSSFPSMVNCSSPVVDSRFASLIGEFFTTWFLRSANKNQVSSLLTCGYFLQNRFALIPLLGWWESGLQFYRFCTVVGVLGIISAAAGIVGEATSYTAANYITSIILAVLAIITQIYISGYMFVKRNAKSTPMSKLFSIFSWVATVVVVILMLYSVLTRHDNFGWHGYFYWHGTFSLAGTSSLLSAVFGIASYLTALSQASQSTTTSDVAFPMGGNLDPKINPMSSFPPQQYYPPPQYPPQQFPPRQYPPQ